jgi:hypothetical protein
VHHHLVTSARESGDGIVNINLKGLGAARIMGIDLYEKKVIVHPARCACNPKSNHKC